MKDDDTDERLKRPIPIAPGPAGAQPLLPHAQPNLAQILGVPAIWCNQAFVTVEGIAGEDGAVRGEASRLTFVENNPAYPSALVRAAVAIPMHVLIQMHASIGRMLVQAGVKVEAPNAGAPPPPAPPIPTRILN